MGLRLPALALGLGLLLVAATGGQVGGGGSPAAGAETGAAASFVWPVTGFVMTQGFGCTDLLLEPVEPACPGGHFHTGLDLAAVAGTPVRAAGSGVVVQAVAGSTGYGNHVLVDHGHGVTTLYGHLSQMSVGAGQLVLRGELIGRVGSTGNSTGPHLHFEVRAQGRPVDPESHLPAPIQRGAFQ